MAGDGQKRLVTLKLDPEVVKKVDLYAAERDLYRNRAVEELIEKAVAQGGDAEGRSTNKFD